MEQFYWAALGAAKGIDTARMLVLVRAFGSAQNLYEAEEQDILATGIVAPECASRFVEYNRKNRKLPEMLRDQCERSGISVVPVVSQLYPERHSVVSNSLRPHGLQHARPPCPSPTPGVYPNSCPLSW